jgi:dihydrodipicolinate synthase/N-acetylneuraminate lyase
VRASRLIVSELSIAGVKFAMDLRGYRGGIPRQPLLPLAEEQKRRVTEFIYSLEPQAARA